MSFVTVMLNEIFEKVDKNQMLKYKINLDNSRNENLSESGKAMLLDRYLLEDETYQDLFARVATHYADDQNHAQRLYDYMSNFWFMPATPVLSNGGAKLRGERMQLNLPWAI